MAINEITTIQWAGLALGAMLIGMGKAGIKGTGLLIIPIMAEVFGGKASSGLILPILSMADIIAVRYYNRHAQWAYIWKLLPAAAIGVFLGIWVGELINDEVFKSIMAIIILGSLAFMVWREWGGKQQPISSNWYMATLFGLLGGFCTMIGNAAGPIMATYLLATDLPKNNFIGTGAWFFLLLNLFKIPFHIFIWNTISWQSFGLNLSVLPAILLGVALGIRLVKIIPEKQFRYFVIAMTFLVAIRLLF